MTKIKRKALAIPVPGPGRKSLYREEYADQAFKLCLLGAKDSELANFFEVCERTLNNWKDEHPAFLQSIIGGRVKADAEVANSLYKMATGHQIKAEKLVKKEDGTYEAIRFNQYIPGDSAAAYRWLLNRRRQDWADRSTVEQTVKLDITVEQRASEIYEDIFGPTPHEIIANG